MDKNALINKFIHLFEVMFIPTIRKKVYLTFDDGPEEGITESILGLLGKYGFKATFFCCGINVEKNQDLIKLIMSKGHSIANHSYSHVLGYTTNNSNYIEDVLNCDKVISRVTGKKCYLFRPPGGEITLLQWLKLMINHKVIYWSLISRDHIPLDRLNVDEAICNLKKSTQRGKVILFHFSKEHEASTMALLPAYLEWLNKNGWISDGLK